MQRASLLLLFVWGALAPVASAADDEQLAKQLKSLVEANFKANNEKNLEATLATIHSESPSLLPTRSVASEQFEHFDLKVNLIDFKVFGRDDTYAVARVKQKTVKERGPSFKNNLLDAMWIFRQEDNTWKLWTSATLNITYLEE